MTLHRFPSPGFWPRYGVTIRPWLCVVSGATGMVGIALADAPSAVAVWVGACVFVLTYGLGQALTDTTQTDTDALSAPERPLPRGELSVVDVRWLSLALLALCAVALAWLNPWTLAVSALAVIGLATYTPLKRRWWGGPPWNAWIVACLVWLGALVAGGNPVAILARPGVLLAMGSAFFGYAVFVLLGYLKDVESDRATGYETVAVRFGRRTTVGISAVSAAASIALSAWLLWTVPSDQPFAPLLMLGLGGIAMVVAHVLCWRAYLDDLAWPGIVASVVGFVALRCAEVAWLDPTLLAGALVLLVATGPALTLRPNRAQV